VVTSGQCCSLLHRRDLRIGRYSRVSDVLQSVRYRSWLRSQTDRDEIPPCGERAPELQTQITIPES
jgi:hypothetical protein